MISRHQPADLPAVHQLLRDNGWPESALPTVEAIDWSIAFVAIDAARVVGFVRIISDRTMVSYIAEIAVATDMRFKGVGQRLIDACERQFPKARIDLLSTLAARSFYENVGFARRPGYRRWPA